MNIAKKIKTALIAGCSVLCISSFAFAATPAQTDNATAQPAQTQATTQMSSGSTEGVNEMFASLTKQMVQENKMTQAEADALTNYLHNAQEEFAQMTDEQKAAFIEEHKAMTPEERVAQISVKTNIDADRLVQIFADMKQIVASRSEAAQA